MVYCRKYILSTQKVDSELVCNRLMDNRSLTGSESKSDCSEPVRSSPTPVQELLVALPSRVESTPVRAPEGPKSRVEPDPGALVPPDLAARTMASVTTT